jgi:pilus assembly protein CpaB
MRRPLVFMVLAAFAAGLASLVVYSSLKKKDLEVQSALATTVPIVVAARDIPVGAKIDSSAIKLARWPRNALPAGAITDSGSIMGNVARAEFVANEPIVAGRLVAADKTSGVLPLMIPSDMRAMSVAVDEVSDMAGFILPYTRVDVLLSLNGNDRDGSRSKIVLQNIPVLAVAQTVDHRDSPEPERVVTLLVSPDQAERLAVASSQGKLQLALRGYGDNGYVATSGSDVHKVMGGSEEVVSEPVPVQQTLPPAPAKVRIRRVISGWAHRITGEVEVLRDGKSRDVIPLAADGRALASASSANASSPADTPSAGSPSLGTDDSTGSNNGSTPDTGMGASLATGDDSK